MVDDIKPLNILYVTHGYKPAYRLGGPVMSVSGAAEELVSRGHKVVVYTSNSNLDKKLDVPINQPVSVNGVEIWYFDVKKVKPNTLLYFNIFTKSVGFLYTPQIISVLDHHIFGFDLIHTQMPFVYPTLVAGRKAIKVAKPLFYQHRAVFSPGYLRYRKLLKQIYISLFEKPIMRRANILIALTPADISCYRDLGLKQTIRVVPNGVNLADYDQSVKGKFESTELNALNDDKTVILFLSRFHPVKGMDILLNAFIKISGLYSDSILVFAGPDQHGLRDQLSAKARSVGLGDRVIFPGFISGDQKRNLLTRADLFCLPSAAEGFSIAILEALASATPVLITPECNFHEILTHEAGWIAERDVGEWVKFLSQILENKSKLKSIGKNGFNLVKSSYTWDNVVNKLESVYYEGLHR
ncbi:MAG: glycosyltransferase [Anaerolineales bacterium]|jgi:glycosyltransferase involved in cell wall biosynthesis